MPHASYPCRMRHINAACVISMPYASYPCRMRHIHAACDVSVLSRSIKTCSPSSSLTSARPPSFSSSWCVHVPPRFSSTQTNRGEQIGGEQLNAYAYVRMYMPHSSCCCVGISARRCPHPRTVSGSLTSRSSTSAASKEHLSLKPPALAPRREISRSSAAPRQRISTPVYHPQHSACAHAHARHQNA